MHKQWRWVPAMGGLALAFCLVMLSTLALNINLGRMRDSLAWVQHTDEVLLQCAVIDGNVVEAESVERGYLLTGDGDYRENFLRVRDALLPQYDRLLGLVPDNPRQQELLDKVRPLLVARLDELSQVVTLGPAHMDAALSVVRDAKSRQLTSLIRDQLLIFRQNEIDLLDRRQRQSAREMTWSIALAAATIILALLSASFGLFLFQRARTVHRERELQAELIHVSRLNMMGQMASMLAHELNQPLTATGNYLGALLRLTKANEPPQRDIAVDALTRSIQQMSRAGEIVRRLRRFIEKGSPTKTAEEVGPMLDEAIALLGMRRDALTVSCYVAPDLPAVLVDKIQVEQVLINLMRNAIEAMERSSSRLLELSARSVRGEVLIAVRDTGAGLPREIAARLFQPFVTSKKGGLGVGLSICHTIVVANGGRIWAEPNPGGGTVFYLTLPVASGGDVAIVDIDGRQAVAGA
jgi:two-component system sensor kinase FixL